MGKAKNDFADYGNTFLWPIAYLELLICIYHNSAV